jgi:hypothetical protein
MRAILVATLFVASVASAAPPTIGNEVIEIHDQLPPKVVAKPAENFYRTRLPPYSEKAILADVWTSAWLLLDIDPNGTVQRIKFLVHPGYDLENIAMKEVFAQTFEPALDAHGDPMPSRIAWRIEWPSHGWVSFLNDGQTTNVPREQGWPPRPAASFVPCRGSGTPWAFDSAYPVYRDCRVPDFKRAIEHESWIYRSR